jgi:hypothetical protein
VSPVLHARRLAARRRIIERGLMRILQVEDYPKETALRWLLAHYLMSR